MDLERRRLPGLRSYADHLATNQVFFFRTRSSERVRWLSKRAAIISTKDLKIDSSKLKESIIHLLLLG